MRGRGVCDNSFSHNMFRSPNPWGEERNKLGDQKSPITVSQARHATDGSEVRRTGNNWKQEAPPAQSPIREMKSQTMPAQELRWGKTAETYARHPKSWRKTKNKIENRKTQAGGGDLWVQGVVADGGLLR